MQVVLVTPGLVPLHELPYRNDVDRAGSHY